MVKEVVKAEVNAVARYERHDVNKAGSLNITLAFDYSELTNYVQVLQMLNNDIKIKVKKSEMKPFSLGQYRLKNFSVSHDGECKIQFNTITDYAEMMNIVELSTIEKDERFKVRFEAEIELEDSEEDEG